MRTNLITMVSTHLVFQVHTGRWLVDGNPQIVLFDIGSAAHELDHYKHELYEGSKIGIPHGDAECNDSVIFGFMVAKFLEEVRLCLCETYVFYRFIFNVDCNHNQTHI